MDVTNADQLQYISVCDIERSILDDESEGNRSSVSVRQMDQQLVEASVKQLTILGRKVSDRRTSARTTKKGGEPAPEG